VGLDVRKDIHWAVYPATESKRLLAEGRIDAVMLWPPYSQELRAQAIGHVVVNSALDRPWSQYFCRRAIPPMTAHTDDLKHRLQREHDGHKKPRLQRLYVLASGHAHTRQDVAQLLGVHRHTIGRWLARDASGGLDALLATYIPAGKPVSLAPAVLASLGHALHRAEGFAYYEALRQWVRQTHGVELKAQHARHPGACALQGEAQGGPAESYQKSLRPFRCSRPPVRHTASG
jgi:transposase